MQLPISSRDAEHFAERWIAAWNSGDIERIMAFYRQDIVFYSPFAVAYPDRPTGEVQGMEALKAYWAWCLRANPDTEFSMPKHIITTDNSICLIYRGAHRLTAIETMIFDVEGMIVRARCEYLEQQQLASEAIAERVNRVSTR